MRFLFSAKFTKPLRFSKPIGIGNRWIMRLRNYYYGSTCDVLCANGAYADGICTCDAGYKGDMTDLTGYSKHLSAITRSSILFNTMKI